MNQLQNTTFLLMRHAETDWNLERRFQGQQDIPLNATGLLQAKALPDLLAEKHPDIAAIYSSDLLRAHQTALKTGEQFKLPVATCPTLREQHGGIKEGMVFPERGAYSSLAPGEEPLSAVTQRIEKKLFTLAQNHPQQKIAIFSHGMALKAWVAYIDATPPKELSTIYIPNCGILEVELSSTSSWTLLASPNTQQSLA